jgi:signal recognition particle subunit SRP68
MTETDCDTLDEEITVDSTVLKRDWFSFNGGSLSTNDASYKKPLFFDIALNYVELDMIRLQNRAGKQPPPAPKMVQPQVLQQQPQKTPIAKAKAEEVERQATPEPAAPARGGLGGLLGGWWGRK